MKKLLLILFAACFVTLQALAFEHIVQRGETLESVAQKYGISVATLLRVNPGCQNLFYPGLKLQIPERQTQPALQAPANQSNQGQGYQQQPVQSQAYPYQPSQINGQAPTLSEEKEEAKPGIEPCFQIGFGFLPKPKGSHDNFTYEATIGINYWILDKVKGPYVGARLGYKGATYFKSQKINGYYYNGTTSLHTLSIPVEIGYALTTENKNFGVVPFVGLATNIALKGTIESGTGSHKTKTDMEEGGHFYPEFMVGAHIRICEFNITATGNLGLGKYKMSDDFYFAIGIGWGF